MIQAKAGVAIADPTKPTEHKCTANSLRKGMRAFSVVSLCSPPLQLRQDQCRIGLSPSSSCFFGEFGIGGEPFAIRGLAFASIICPPCSPVFRVFSVICSLISPSFFLVFISVIQASCFCGSRVIFPPQLCPRLFTCLALLLVFLLVNYGSFASAYFAISRFITFARAALIANFHDSIVSNLINTIKGKDFGIKRGGHK